MKAHVPVLGHHHTHLSRADYVTGRRRTSDVENFEMATIIAFIQPAEYAFLIEDNKNISVFIEWF